MNRSKEHWRMDNASKCYKQTATRLMNIKDNEEKYQASDSKDNRDGRKEEQGAVRT
jgi:hypothetical protein